MPLEKDDEQRVHDAIKNAGDDRLVVLNAAETQKLGFWTVICTVFNRAIGSGVFVTPAILLKATGSPGASLLLWLLGAVASICAVLVWLEFGLSIPKFLLKNHDDNGTPAEGESLQSVPRSGGEKNYLEYVYGSNRFRKLRTTCMYGLIYITLGNLSGNSIAFGTFILEAAGKSAGHDSLARGLAVVCMTAACLLHGIYRQGGIYVIIIMAIFKICILLAIIAIGFAAMDGRTFGNGTVKGQVITDKAAQTGPGNLGVHNSFAYAKTDFANYAHSILFVVYTFSGNEQPFYVLSEVIRPKKIFAKAMITAVTTLVILFMLVHVAYLGVVSYDPNLDALVSRVDPTLNLQCLSVKDTVDKFNTTQIDDALANPSTLKDKCRLDMATVFFAAVFGGDVARRVMSGIIAASIFGNVVVMTFTASRVKQEIAKEGILPFSLFFARSTITPWALLRRRLFPRDRSYEAESSPAPALFLHWIFSMILLGASSTRTPDVAYQILVSLYSYTVVILVGFFTSAGLLYARFFREEGNWVERSGFKPWGGPMAAIIYMSLCAFLLVAPFVPPKEGSPFLTDVKWFIVPTIGLGFLALGYAYYLGLVYLVPKFFMKNKQLVADREAVIIREQGEYVQYLEIVDASWEATSAPSGYGNGYGHGDGEVEMPRVTVTDQR